MMSNLTWTTMKWIKKWVYFNGWLILVSYEIAQNKLACNAVLPTNILTFSLLDYGWLFPLSFNVRGPMRPRKTHHILHIQRYFCLGSSNAFFPFKSPSWNWISHMQHEATPTPITKSLWQPLVLGNKREKPVNRWEHTTNHSDYIGSWRNGVFLWKRPISIP